MKLFRGVVTACEFPCLGCMGESGVDAGRNNSFCPDVCPVWSILPGSASGCGGELDGRCRGVESVWACRAIWKEAVAVMPMRGFAEELILSVFSAGESALARPLAELGAPLIAGGFGSATGCPVPLHFLRR